MDDVCRNSSYSCSHPLCLITAVQHAVLDSRRPVFVAARSAAALPLHLAQSSLRRCAFLRILFRRCCRLHRAARCLLLLLFLWRTAVLRPSAALRRGRKRSRSLLHLQISAARVAKLSHRYVSMDAHRKALRANARLSDRGCWTRADVCFLLCFVIWLCSCRFERLPVPYGLVRFGVAPDHPDVKAVSHEFEAVINDARFAFWGNVEVVGEGQEKEKGMATGAATSATVSIGELRRHYAGVVLAYGAASERTLHIPGSHLRGIHPSRHLVNWYNAHPEQADAQRQFDLAKVKDVVIIGSGRPTTGGCGGLRAQTRAGAG